MALVIPIMLLSTIGIVALIGLCGGSIWGFIYLIKYRLMRYPAHTARNEVSTVHDIAAIIICLISLAAVAVILIYGMPIVMKYLPDMDKMIPANILQTK